MSSVSSRSRIEAPAAPESPPNEPPCPPRYLQYSHRQSCEAARHKRDPEETAQTSTRKTCIAAPYWCSVPMNPPLLLHIHSTSSRARVCSRSWDLRARSIMAVTRRHANSTSFTATAKTQHVATPTTIATPTTSPNLPDQRKRKRRRAASDIGEPQPDDTPYPKLANASGPPVTLCG